MIRIFFKDNLIYVASGILSRGLSILLIPIYTRFLSPIEYGVYDILLISATLAGYVATLELNQGFARHYFEADDIRGKRSYVSTAFFFIAASYSIFLFLTVTFSHTISAFLFGTEIWWPIIALMGVASGCNGIFFFFQDVLRVRFMPLRHTYCSICYSMLSGVVGIGGVVGLDAGLAGIAAGQIVGAVIAAALAIRFGAASDLGLAFDGRRLVDMLTYSVPQVFSSFAAYLALTMDRYFIKELVGLEDAGIYAVGARIATVVSLVMTGFQSGYIPLVFRNHADPGAPLQMERAFRLFLFFALLTILVLSSFSREITTIFATENFNRYWMTVPILAGSTVLSGLYIFVPGVFIAKKTVWALGVNLCGLALAFAANTVFVPWLGALGGALSAACVGIATFSAYAALNQRTYPMPLRWGRIVTGFLLLLMFAASAVLLQEVSGILSLVSRVLCLPLGGALLWIVLLTAPERLRAVELLRWRGARRL